MTRHITKAFPYTTEMQDFVLKAYQGVAKDHPHRRRFIVDGEEIVSVPPFLAILRRQFPELNAVNDLALRSFVHNFLQRQGFVTHTRRDRRTTSKRPPAAVLRETPPPTAAPKKTEWTKLQFVPEGATHFIADGAVTFYIQVD